MITEREHWLQVTRSRNWKREHIFDPNICPAATINAVTSAFPDDPKRVLEIGCGFGRLASLVAKQYPGCEVTGIDINPDILEHGLPGVTYVCRDSLGFLPQQDAVYSVTVFQHLTADEKHDYICQAYDRLNDGGVLRIQYIEGELDQFVEHWSPPGQMQIWMMTAGFKHLTVDRGLAHPQWSWIAARK